MSKVKDISKNSMAQVSIGQEHNMRLLAEAISESLGKGVGFTLLVFPMNSSTGRMSYVSNANRKDMLEAIESAIGQLKDATDIPASTSNHEH